MFFIYHVHSIFSPLSQGRYDLDVICSLSVSSKSYLVNTVAHTGYFLGRGEQIRREAFDVSSHTKTLLGMYFFFKTFNIVSIISQVAN